MHFEEKTLDDLMLAVLKELVKLPSNVNASRGKSSEIIGALLHLTNPLARLSRTETKGKAFSALGELLWYLSEDNRLDFIEYYISAYKKESEDGKTIHGGYGPRLFKLHGDINQIKNVIDLLRTRPDTRKAVIQLYDGRDLHDMHKEFPCTCKFQFFIRDKKLYMFTSMRSNDAFKGLPHDIFAFTMLQEIFARTLDVDLGTYSHAVGSLHLYDENRAQAETFINEGYQSTIKTMMPMPKGDPWSSINIVQENEVSIRNNSETSDIDSKQVDPYWMDLTRLLKIFAYSRNNDIDGIKEVKAQMNSKVFDIYIDNKIKRK